jgi:hypothetical protein
MFPMQLLFPQVFHLEVLNSKFRGVHVRVTWSEVQIQAFGSSSPGDAHLQSTRAEGWC